MDSYRNFVALMASIIIIIIKKTKRKNVNIYDVEWLECRGTFQKEEEKKNKRKTARIGSGCDGNRPRQIGGTRSADGVVGRRSSFVSHLVFLDFWVLVVARRRFSISSSLLLTWALLFFFCFVCFLFLPICLSVAAIKENEIEKCLKKKGRFLFWALALGLPCCWL